MEFELHVDNIDITTSANGVVLPVKALPGSRGCALRGIIDGQLKVSVTAVAEKGIANIAIAEFLAQLLSLPKRQIRILAGQTSGQKKFELTGISVSQLKDRLALQFEKR